MRGWGGPYGLGRKRSTYGKINSSGSWYGSMNLGWGRRSTFDRPIVTPNFRTPLFAAAAKVPEAVSCPIIDLIVEYPNIQSIRATMIR